MKSRILALAGVTVAGVVSAPAAHAAKSNPETNAKAAPTADAGYFLGTQGPTYSWHGCTATATQRTLSAMQNPIVGEPPIRTGSKQAAVTFKTSPTQPFVTWQAKPGWRICGAQASVLLSSPAVDAQLWSQIGYTSGAASGSTGPRDETVTVKIPKGTFGGGSYQKYDGQTFTIREVRAVTVFVKRR